MTEGSGGNRDYARNSNVVRDLIIHLERTGFLPMPCIKPSYRRVKDLSVKTKL